MKAWGRLLVYLKESFGELKKITWPQKSEVLSSTKIVLIVICLFALILGVFDYLMGVFVRFLFY